MGKLHVNVGIAFIRYIHKKTQYLSLFNIYHRGHFLFLNYILCA